MISVCVLAVSLTAAEMQERARLAYEAYAEDARRAFLIRVREGAAPTAVRSDGASLPRDGQITVRAAREDGIIGVPGGLVHHWRGEVFMRGVTLRQALAVSQRYSAYAAIYTPIVASTPLGQEGNTFRVFLRIKESVAGISATLDIKTTIQYFHPDERHAYALGVADEIREVKNAGEKDERLLPAGKDSGYLWKAGTFTNFVEHSDGVCVEMETLGLSRGYGPMLAWIVEPIARRLGRRSVEASLKEFHAAVSSSRK